MRWGIRHFFRSWLLAYGPASNGSSIITVHHGISSRVTDTSKNALNSTGLLRHSTPITALKHYTRAQKDSIAAAMKTVEEDAAELIEKQKQERVQ